MSVDPVNAKMIGAGIITAVTLDIFGIPPGPILWGLVGGVIGAGFTEPAPFFKSIGIYISASLISALIGSALGDYFFPNKIIWANSGAAFVGIFFHPALSAMIQKVPSFFDALLSTIGRRGQP